MASERRPNGYWENLENRVNAIKELVAKTGKEPKELTTDDFEQHGLASILHYCHNSPYIALKEAGLVDFEPWEMTGGVPHGHWKESKKNCVRATKYVLVTSGKKPQDLTSQDFKENGLNGLLTSVYKGSPFNALLEAGLVDFEPWEMKSHISAGYWKNKAHRVSAVKWLVARTGKKPKELTKNDFLQSGLRGLLRYTRSYHDALKEADLANFKHWELGNGKAPNGYWKKSEQNRVIAIKRFVAKIGKKPNKITAMDFIRNGLSGLLDFYNNSPYYALREAGYVVQRKYQNRIPSEQKKLRGYWQKLENRVKEARAFVAKIGKDANKITARDFYENGMRSLLRVYNSSPSAALREAGYDVDEMKRKTPNLNPAELLNLYVQS